ncbi:hypothetical protein EVAR_44284_1 [Eumeta japonica]|uniref:Uncharacterized protein n=1 Tax=Eumeta variegata TaxID=151549 RepID=A0A4C1WQL7_EUMVA|nr:hypothetical protein EVAR_44284_1 [Eumeta japonica]
MLLLLLPAQPECRCGVTTSAVSFCSVNASSGGPLPSPSGILVLPERSTRRWLLSGYDQEHSPSSLEEFQIRFADLTQFQPSPIKQTEYRAAGYAADG